VKLRFLTGMALAMTKADYANPDVGRLMDEC
jgi:hypothetical protein